VNPLGYRTSYTYENGQQKTVKDPLGVVSTTMRDLSNRVLAQVNPLGDRTSYLYDGGCRQVASIDPLGSVTGLPHSAKRQFGGVWELG